MSHTSALRRALGALVPSLALALASATPGSAATLSRAGGPPAVSVITTGLDVPWDIAFLPDGRALVTERTGAVRIVSADGGLAPTPAARLTVSQNGEGGLLGIALDPAYSAATPFVYLTATVGAQMQVQRWRFAADRLVMDGVVIGGITMGTIHSSGRVRFGPDGAMYVGTGDAGDGWRAQSTAVPNGKVLRVAAGAYRGAPVTPAFYATGLRNPQGFAWQPGSGRFFSTDHGPSGFDGPSGDDELDLIAEGANYGWPFARGADHGPYAAPVHLWPTTIAPSGLEFVTLPGSTWTGRALVAGLKGKVLRLLTFDGARVTADEPLLANAYGRLRGVAEAPDGAIWVTTSNRDGRGTPIATDDRIIRIVPPAGTPAGQPSLPLQATPAPRTGSGAAPSPAVTPPSGSLPVVTPPHGLESIAAPRSVRLGSAVRIRALFAAVPAGRVALQVRRARGWVTIALASPRTRRVAFTFRPSSGGARVMRLRHRFAGRWADTPISLRVRG